MKKTDSPKNSDGDGSFSQCSILFHFDECFGPDRRCVSGLPFILYGCNKRITDVIVNNYCNRETTELGLRLRKCIFKVGLRAHLGGSILVTIDGSSLFRTRSACTIEGCTRIMTAASARK